MLKTRNQGIYHLILTALIFLLPALSIGAATFTVTKTADTADGVCDADCSLREALTAANAAGTTDEIVFAGAVFSTPQTITLNGTEMIIANNGGLTIDGPGADKLTISGNNLSRIFTVNSSAVVVINGVKITNGRVPGMITGNRGGGILNIGGNLTVNNSIVTNNRSFDGGGGIYNFNIGTLTVNYSTISNNTCESAAGGGISSDDGSTIVVNNSTISGNTAPSGGGIYNAVAASITNTTVSGNTATTFGGGIVNDNGGASNIFNISNSTIVNNSAGLQGGGVWRNSGTVNVKNTIVANNAANTAPDFRGALVSQGYNLIENSTGATIGGVTTGNILGEDPQLLPLGSYGGRTQTHALRVTSPALDKGNNFEATVDQRGLTRPYDNPLIPNAAGGNGSDIGAFERQLADTPVGVAFDFDGDAKTDISIYRPSAGEWWLNRSSTGATVAVQFGASTDKPVPADFTGDGKTDIAFWRPSTGEWFILRSEDSSFYSVPFGASGDVPVTGDFDGDGRADVGVFRPATNEWFVSKSAGGTLITTFGVAGDKPVAADYDGDGKTDLAVYRPSAGEWWIQRSRDLSVMAAAFGVSTDKPVPGDYSGDGRADLALFRPSTGEWLILRSENGSYYSVPFGAAGDVPTPGDYDGDGRFDTAVFRPSGATWFVQRSTAGILITNFGIGGDRPLPNAFVP